MTALPAPRSTFVTGDRPPDAFREGFLHEVREWDATLLGHLRFNAGYVNRDATTIHLGPAYVTVTGLELVAAADPYGLGAAKARELIDRYTAPSDLLARSLAGLEHTTVVPTRTPLMDRLARG